MGRKSRHLIFIPTANEIFTLRSTRKSMLRNSQGLKQQRIALIILPTLTKAYPFTLPLNRNSKGLQGPLGQNPCARTGRGSLGWSLDGVYIHQVPSKKLLNRKPQELLTGTVGIYGSIKIKFIRPIFQILGGLNRECDIKFPFTVCLNMRFASSQSLNG